MTNNPTLIAPLRLLCSLAVGSADFYELAANEFGGLSLMADGMSPAKFLNWLGTGLLGNKQQSS